MHPELVDAVRRNGTRQAIDRVMRKLRAAKEPKIRFEVAVAGLLNFRVLIAFLAGASSVQVGTATFADPLAPLKVIEGLAAYVREHELASIRDVIGAALPARED